MTKSLQYSLGILAILAIVFLLNQRGQNQYEASSDAVFNGDKSSISKIEILDSNGSITLVREDSTWSILGADSLVMKEQQIKNFFDKVVLLEKEILISKNAEKWDKFNVGDSTGKHLFLYAENHELLGMYVIGSGTDYSRNFIRIGDQPNVYRTNSNVQYLLNTSPTYWGKIPPKPAVNDTLSPVNP